MSARAHPRSHLAEILARIVGPEEGNLTPESAGATLKLKLDEWNRKRGQELAIKNQEGKLTKPEVEEIEAYQRAGRLLAFLSAKTG